MKKVRVRIFSILGGITAVSKLLGITKQGTGGYLNNLKRKIPYQFAVYLAFLTGIEIEKIAPYAKKANEIISEFLLKKSLSQFDNKIIGKITIGSASKFGKKIIITDDNFLISGCKTFKKMLRGEKDSRHVVILPIDEILRGKFNLNILDFSNIEKLLIAAHLNKVLKQDTVFASDTISKMLLNIVQFTLEELTFFDYLTKHASKKMILYIDLGVISLSEAYAFVKESEAEYELETINRQQYFEHSPQKSPKRIQDAILHTEFGCAI